MSNGTAQLLTIIKKNYIEKKRNLRNSLCEYCSHLIILLLLVFGYGLSEITHYDAEIYSSVNITIPPPWINTNNNIQLSGLFTSLEDYLSGPLPIPSFDTFVLTSLAISSAVGDDKITSLATSSSFGQTYGNLLTLGTLHFAPDSPEVDSLIQYLNDTTATFQRLKYYKHESENKAIRYIQNHLGEYTWALIVIHSIDPSNINYEIRLNYTTLPNTNEVVNWISIGLDTTYQRYYLSGFLSLQDIIDQWAFQHVMTAAEQGTETLINGTNLNTCRKPAAASMPFPTAAFDQNIFFLAVGFLLGLAMTMATMYPMSRLVKSVVEEKESKMREVLFLLSPDLPHSLAPPQVMKIMGLRDWAHQGAWFITAFILFFWIAISSTFIAHVSFLPKTDPFLLFLYFFTFCLSEVTFSFLIASFFSKAKLAAMVAPVVLFASVLPRFIFYSSNPYEQQQSKYFASLLSPTAFTFGADILANYEYAGVGVQVYNMDQGLYSFSGSLRMMFADFVIYGILAWYLDQVIPLEVGTPKHPLFLFHLSYWFPVWSKRNIADFEFSQPMEFDPSASSSDSSIQPIPENEREQVRVRISHLRKRYGDGKLAVKDFSLSLLEGHITCLLGHNGAGKTTTLSILTGLIEPSRGDCLIWNSRLSSELAAIRQLTGICPQHNVLFPALTVKEHLVFFARMKGVYGPDLESSVERCIEDVGLVEKRDVLSSALSGGMKRKLCLAMALIGDPKFVLLDEPTSGMDPYSRRSTWELLQKSKAGRVIILTTHFMDEADLLGDRIAIMSEGKLRCSGSPLFLKSRFGAGYILTVSKGQGKLRPHLDEDLLRLLRRVVPQTKLASSVAGEVIFNLPITSAPSFGELFQMIKAQKEEYCLSSYGICITTLEQVFIQLAHENKHTLEQEEDDEEEEGIGLSPFFAAALSSLGHQQKHVSKRIVSPVEEEVIKNSGVEMVGVNENTQQQQRLGQQKGQEEGEVMDTIPNQESQTSSPPASAQYFPLSPHEEPHNALGDVESDGKGSAGGKSLIQNLGGWSENQFLEKVSTQLWELLRKRWVIALRDPNGLFFQLVLPAIQIALVLSILMIDVNPAGHSLTLNAAMFPVHPTALYSEGPRITPQQALYHSNLNRIRMDLQPLVNSTTSLQSSELMLESYSNPEGGDRFGAYVFDDMISANVTVDWQWVGENVDLLLNNSDAILSLLQEAGVVSSDFNFNDLISLDSGNFDSSQLLLDFFNITNDQQLTLNLTQTIRTVADRLFGNNNNSNTTITLFNQTFTESELIDALEALLLPQNSSALVNVTVGQLDGSVQIKSIQIVNGEVRLVGVTIEINNRTLELGNVTLTSEEIQGLLPNTTETYSFQIPSAYSVLHNTSSPHAVAAFLGELTASMFQSCSLSNETTTRYKSKNHPLPLTAQESLEIQVILSIFASLFILIPLCYIPASFVVFIVRERESKSKHLQIVSSISPFLYWIATYMWDMALYSVLTGLIMITFFSYGENASRIFIATNEATIAVFLLLFLYGTSAIPISYLYSFAFDNHSTAQISIMTINFFTGFVTVMAYYIMISIPSTKSLGESLVHIFRFFPPYNIGEGLINISAAYFSNELLDEHVSYLSYRVTGRNIVHLVVETGVYFTLVLLSEANWIRQIGYWAERQIFLAGGYDKQLPMASSVEMDEDVLAEATLVKGYRVPQHQLNHQGAAAVEGEGEYMLVLRDIVKTYPPTLLLGQPKHAVRGMNLACAAGERFGLLGINGAGKSTTLSILTGDIQPTRGEAFIAGLPLSNPSTRDLIGYCPQTDPLLDLMTGYETLWFFGRIRGMNPEALHLRCLELIEQVGLTNHAFKPCGSYSGGNKRKLSLAVALIGNPKVLFLDEPSSGMDPEARRHMWEVISSVSSDRSIVITTHSMEECEAICTRIGIMVSGHLQCLGSSQHLKSRFGAGYQLDVSFPSQTLKQQFLIQFCSTQQPIPVSSRSDLSHTEDTKQQEEETGQGMEGNDNPLRGLVVEEDHPHYLRCKLTNEIDLAEAFTCLERLKTQPGEGEGGMIADYSLSQATLEQIFINFAKHQEEEQHPHPQAPRPAEAPSQQPSQQETAGGAGAPISDSQATGR